MCRNWTKSWKLYTCVLQSNGKVWRKTSTKVKHSCALEKWNPLKGNSVCITPTIRSTQVALDFLLQRIMIRWAVCKCIIRNGSIRGLKISFVRFFLYTKRNKNKKSTNGWNISSNLKFNSRLVIAKYRDQLLVGCVVVVVVSIHNGKISFTSKYLVYFRIFGSVYTEI